MIHSSSPSLRGREHRHQRPNLRVRSNSSSNSGASVRILVTMAQKIEKDRRWWTGRWECPISTQAFFASLHHEDFTYKDGTLRNRADVPSWRGESQSKAAATLQWQSSIPTARYHLGERNVLLCPHCAQACQQRFGGTADRAGMECHAARNVDWEATRRCRKSGVTQCKQISPIGRFCGTGSISTYCQPKSGQHAFP